MDGNAHRRVTDRERFLTFALAAAEILLEVSPDGRILFAAGALQSRLGAPAEAWVGRPVRDILARADRQGFDLAFAGLQARDRLPPICFHLADARRTPMSCAGLRLIGQDAGRICLTFAAMPGSPGEARSASGPAALRDAAELAARDGGSAGTLGLIELRGDDGPLTPSAEIAERIRETIADGLAPDAVAGELAAGRYGLISAAAPDLDEIGARIASVVGAGASVATRSVSLQAEGLTPMQASRALRHALACFTRDGPEALDQAGFGAGLSGFVAEAYARAVWLRRAIAERRFRLAFQPIVALADRTPHHFEALLRPEPDADSPVQWRAGIRHLRRNGGTVRGAGLGGAGDRLRRGARGRGRPASPPTSPASPCRARPSASGCWPCWMPSRCCSTAC